MSEGFIAWMARTRVTANLLMIVLIVGGLVMITQVKKEIFPEYELDYVQVTVPYPGASPEEVEKGIILSIEDKVRSLDGVKRVTSSAVEGSGVVSIELMNNVNPNKLLQDIKNRVDQIQSFPEEAERPIVGLLETKRQVVSVILYGNVTPETLRSIGERTREELLTLPNVTLVELVNAQELEVNVEIPESTLRTYNLTLAQIANLVRRTSLELPGGGVKTPGGEVLLRTQERRELADEFKNIPVVSNLQGADVTLGQIASVREGFEDTDQESFYNGIPAIRIDVFRIGDQNPLTIAANVHEYVESLRERLPQTLSVATWDDRSEVFEDRISLLLKNGAMGLVLVLILLGLFLEPRLAFWVTVGIPTSIIGSFLIIPWFADASINMVSLFAFLITLGIIVDDAIVVGESVYQKRERGMNLLDASIEGTKEIAGPVVFAVLTNMASFFPLFFIPGTTGKIFFQIPLIVTSVFIISLIESIYVLPAHLSVHHGNWRWVDRLTQVSIWGDEKLRSFIRGPYLFALKMTSVHRYLTMAFSLAILLLMLILFFAGYIQFSYLPKIDGDLATAQVTMSFGVPIETSRNIQAQIVQAAKEVVEESGQADLLRGIYTQIGSSPSGGGPATAAGFGQLGSHIIVVQAFLVPTDQRKMTGIEFADRWREKTGAILGADYVSFTSTIGETGGKPIALELSHTDLKELEKAAKQLASELKNYKGVSDIDEGFSLGKPQINFKLKPEARSLGITVQDLAEQLRSSFYGAEALRQQRGRNEVKVMVRLPKSERSTIHTLDKLVLRTPNKTEIPLKDAAILDYGRAYSDIRRTDGKRVRTVTADTIETEVNANRVIESLQSNYFPTLLNDFPGLKITLEGQQKAYNESLDAMKVGFPLAMLGIYALLAIPFGSYIQPIIIMLSIPFGIIGALLGHIMLGYEISIMSIFGIVALSGVVVNDSLVLIVTINELRSQGHSSWRAIQLAAQNRFRPILLTSLTTFFGLAPMIFETSVQAKFLIPMAISLGFGVLFTTLITLIVTPSLYLILEDVKKNGNRSI